MNNGCNRWKAITRLHLVLSATLIFLLSFCFADSQLLANAAEMPEIQQRGYLIIAVKNNLHPLGFTDVSGKLQGLEIDLAKALAQDLLGSLNAVKFKPVNNRDRMTVVLNNQVDLTIARVTATESRARLVSFSVPYYFDGTALITKDASAQRIKDFARRKIAVLKKSSTIAEVKYYIPTAELVGVNSYEEARSLLEKNNCDAFAADASVLSGWVQQDSGYHLLSTKLSTQPLSVVMPKGLQYDELRQRVNEAIARYIAKGWLTERVKYWGLPQSELGVRS
jgi:polar amino acid transport system substrate-binding protein